MTPYERFFHESVIRGAQMILNAYKKYVEMRAAAEDAPPEKIENHETPQ